MTWFIFFQSLNLWLHIVSLVLWLGGIAFFLFVFGPAIRALPPGAGVQALNRGRQSLHVLSWVAIILLLITGVLNFIFRGAATDFQFRPGYYPMLSIKLLLFLAMVFHHSLQELKYAPKIVNLTVQTAEDIQSWPEPLLFHWKRWFMLLKINATLGVIVIPLGLGLARS